MPFVNVKLLEKQVDESIKAEIITGITDLVCHVMKRERTLTTIVIDDIKPSSWAIGGKAVDPHSQGVSFVNIKVSKGTTNAEEMALMTKEVKALMSKLLKNHVEANYFIIDELNPAGWGFGDLTMKERAKLEEES